MLHNPLDELFPGLTLDLDTRKSRAKATTKEKPPTKPPAKKSVVIPLPVQRDPHFTPTLSITEVVHQDCSCCGSRTSYVRPRRIRYENGKGAAIELRTAASPALARHVSYIYETVDLCATCITLSRMIDDHFALRGEPCQQELFA